MRGSVNFQVNKLFVDSGIFKPGCSKHAAKISARHSIHKQTPQNIAKHTDIYAYKTGSDYKDEWHRLGRFAKYEYGIKDVTRLEARHVQGYLEKRIEDVTRYSSWKKIVSQVNKLENALNKYTGKEYCFRPAADKVRELAKQKLDTTGPKVKGYENPEKVIQNIVNDNFRLAAKIQLQGGCRREEVSKFKPDQLKGVKKDVATGEKRGFVELKDTKGGKARDIHLSPRTYRELEYQTTQDKKFEIQPASYGRAVALAARAAGEENRGTHDLRYNYAVARYNEIIEKGNMTHEQSLQFVSWEMGHERASITFHYLR